MNNYKIHIFSGIPRIQELISKRLPEIRFSNVFMKGDVSCGNSKTVVTEYELAQLQDAKIIVADGNLIAQVYDKLPNIEWVHCTWAGVEVMARKIKEGKLIHWSHGENDCIKKYRSLQEVTVALLGVGMIGSEVCRALKCFGCKVLGLGRNDSAPNNICLDKYYPMKHLPSFLESADYIVNILPSTPLTRNLLGRNVLAYAKENPIFINIGRGDIIEESEILNALDRKWISGAILDVSPTEPLPLKSPLWTHPKVVITPHIAAVSMAEDVVESFVVNLDRFLAGEELLNCIDWERGY